MLHTGSTLATGLAGLLLITRLGLFLSFAYHSESINIVAVISVTVALLAIRFRVYKHFYNDVLESSFILNLIIFSVITFILKKSLKMSLTVSSSFQVFLSELLS